MSDPTRTPEYDPESVGLPDTFDPDSNAYDEAESVREADGPEQPEWPDRRPLAVDRHGTTAAEAHQGEPLDARLAQEDPDVDPRDSWPADELRDELRDGSPRSDELSLDRGDPGDPVGRLTDPDDDGSGGRNNETVASDAGMAGGGATAEESAMHLVDDADAEEDMDIEDDIDLDL